MLKKIIQGFIIIIQKIFITVALFILYIIGFGVTLLFVSIFNHRLLGIQGLKEDTFWIDAEGYEPDIAGCLRES